MRTAGWAALALAGIAAAAVVLAHGSARRVAGPRPPVPCSGPGTLEALLSANLGAKTATRLLEMRVDVGDRVRAGQVLMVLDRAELGAQAAEASAAAEAARHQAGVAACALDRAGILQDRAARDLRRHERLNEDGLRILSEADLDATRTQARTAAEDAAQARISLAQAVSARAQAAANLAAARSRLRDAEIRAPFDGLVTARYKSPGDVLAPGTALLCLVHEPSLVVVARFDESLLGRMRAGAAARVRFDGGPDQAIPGWVGRINRAVDPDTREFTVNIVLGALPGAWAMGERATVELPDLAVSATRAEPAP